MFGGRAAEELTFGKPDVTTGASDDLRQATELARRMVTEFGFSEKLGPLHYSEDEQASAFGPMFAQHKPVSEETAKLIDEEIRRLVEEAEARARTILNDHAGELRILADTLLERETLSGEEVDAVLRGEHLPPLGNGAATRVASHLPVVPLPDGTQADGTPAVAGG